MLEATKTVSLKDVKIRYGAKTFLDRVNLQIEPGKITLLYGAPGRGKSSLFELLAGLTIPEPGDGEVYWGKNRIKNRSQAHASRPFVMGLVPSSFLFLRNLSVYDNIAMPAMLCGQSDRTIRARLHRLCDVFDFSANEGELSLAALIGKTRGKQGLPIDRLSNGQKELVALARSVMLDTPHLLADEMLRSFDPRIGMEVWRRLSEPEIGVGGRRGLFLITHHNYLKQAEGVDHVWTIHEREPRLVHEETNLVNAEAC